MSTKIAVTFGVQYGPGVNQVAHPIFPTLNGNVNFIVIEADDRDAARGKAFQVTDGKFAFDYEYEVDGVLQPDFQRQVGDYAYTEFAAGVFSS